MLQPYIESDTTLSDEKLTARSDWIERAALSLCIATSDFMFTTSAYTQLKPMGMFECLFWVEPSLG